jgi:ribosomal protein S18 acetylase RimI-like enzyme
MDLRGVGFPALGVSLRAERAEDREFLAKLFASTREEELRAAAWSQAEKEAFLRSQFDLQWSHYRKHYPLAQWSVILRHGCPIGRLYVQETIGELRLMDIALVEPERGLGVGTTLMQVLCEHADRSGLSLTLHVEPFNPALRLYRRLGFEAVETRGIYLFMQRPAQLNVTS